MRLELASLLMPSGVVNPNTNRANMSDCNLWDLQAHRTIVCSTSPGE